MHLTPINGAAARRLVANGALLVDIREECDQGATPLPDAIHAPLSELPRQIGGSRLPAVIYACSTGEMARREAARLAKVSRAPVSFFLDGGACAYETPEERAAPRRMSLDRRYYLLLGAVILASALLGTLVSPFFLIGAVVVGAVLVSAGITGHCDVMAGLQRLSARPEASA